MLSHDTIHVLVGRLADEALYEPASTLIVIHSGPAPDADSPSTYAMQVQTAPMGDLSAWQTGVPGLLTDLRDAIVTKTPQPPLDHLAAAVTDPAHGLELTAIGVHYTDITAMGHDVVPIERIDAVDIDGRVYQVVRIDGGHPWIAVDNAPDPNDIPATQPALAAILAAA
ncbi:hypothetical protein AB0J82_36725 [Asanoa sp. NPDC049518]|uniref:hypothetical protein n=1 Tax=unclassified Asanoa TaxID=2685164 RepID=UPI0034285D58